MSTAGWIYPKGDGGEAPGTMPCLRCRREVCATRPHCPYCGEPVCALPGVIVQGYREGMIVRPMGVGSGLGPRSLLGKVHLTTVNRGKGGKP